MKILIVTRGYPQQHNKMLGLFEKDQALALKAAGYEIAYAVVDIRSIRKRRKFGFNHYFAENGLEIFEMNWPIGPMPRPMIEFFRQQALIRLYPYILQLFGRPDVVHAHFLNYGVISVKLCQQKKLPLIITEHSSYLNTDSLKKPVFKRAQKAYSACDAIIAVSTSLAEHIKNSTGFTARVINNIAAVDVCEFQKHVHEASNDKFAFISAGQLIQRKGMDLLLYSFAEVVKVYPKARLTIYGDGPQKSKLIKLAKRLCIDNKVYFYGAYVKRDIGKLYCTADAFVLPSRGETFGVVYIEAMAVGLPVIATICGGPENFVNEKIGYLIKRDDVMGLTEAMLSMIKNYHNFDNDYIEKYVREHFSSETVAAEITKVYESVLSKRESD